MADTTVVRYSFEGEKFEILVKPDPALDFLEVKKSNPDIIILMPCGFDTIRTLSEYDAILRNNSDWNSLNAVKNNQVFAVDANSFFSKPSIRTVEGLEINGVTCSLSEGFFAICQAFSRLTKEKTSTSVP